MRTETLLAGNLSKLPTCLLGLFTRMCPNLFPERLSGHHGGLVDNRSGLWHERAQTRTSTTCPQYLVPDYDQNHLSMTDNATLNQIYSRLFL